MKNSDAAIRIDHVGYWDDATAAFGDDGAGGAWRSHCDDVHRTLLAGWLVGRSVQRALKTDLFDEMAGGGLSDEMALYAVAVHGIDVSASVVAGASAKRAGIRACRADVRRLPYADGVFDLVVSNSTLDHFARGSDIAASLRELHRVTAAGGTLLITLDNLSNPIIAIRALIPFRALRALGLVPYYVGATTTRRGLAKLLSASGYRVEATTTVLHVPRVIAVRWCARSDRLGDGQRARLLRRLANWERLGRWPTADFTGHFVAALAVRE